jgi:predicted phage-related endonuclease
MLLKFETEQEWLEARKQDVTSTEVAALFGLNPHKSRLRLWHEKRGDVESDFEDNPFTKWGRRLQNAVAEGIAEDEGWDEVEDLRLYYARDPDLGLGSSFDFKVIAEACLQCWKSRSPKPSGRRMGGLRTRPRFLTNSNCRRSCIFPVKWALSRG